MAVGPFFFAPMVAALIASVIVLLVLCAVLTRRVSPQFDRWPWLLMLLALVCARVGFVIRHWDSFLTEPWRIFYVWQGGVDIWWAGAAAVVSLILLSGWRMRAIGAGVLIVVAATMAGLAHWIPGPRAQPMPVMTMQGLDGQSRQTASLAGKKVVVNLWASWCAPCRREMPMLVEAAKQNPDVQFLFINQGEPEPTIRRYLEQEGLDMADMIWLDPDSALSGQFKIRGLPTTLFFNRNALHDTQVGEISKEVLQEKVRGFGAD